MKSNDLNHFLLSDIPTTFVPDKDSLNDINMQRFQQLNAQSFPDDTLNTASPQPKQSMEFMTAYLFYICMKELF